MNFLLQYIIITLIICIFLIIIIPRIYRNLIFYIAFLIVNLILGTIIIIYGLFDNTYGDFQFLWMPLTFNNLILTFGIDGISLVFLILTTIIIPICLLVNKNTYFYFKEIILIFICLELFLICVFCVTDILLFYIFFESILFPMFITIGLIGARTRKIRAAFLFFLYTFSGSILMLIGIITLYNITGTTNLHILMQICLSKDLQLWLWLSFFFSFAVKVPLVPFHVWLPEAHVEAPTSGSVILAGLLLKLGTYGFFRFSLTLFPSASLYFLPFINTVCIFTIIFASITAFRQIDLKRIIAYSSVAHMGIVTLGIFNTNIISMHGCIFLMLSHGIISSGLFLCIGVIYDRFHSRMIHYFGGLVQVMPIFSFLFFLLILGNIGFPGTSGFIGEVITLLGIFLNNQLLAIFAGFSIIITAVYSFFMCNRVIFGNLKIEFIYKFNDIENIEFLIFCFLNGIMLGLGFFPEIFFENLIMGCQLLLY